MDTKTPIEIIPYVGAGAVRFGMSAADVAATVGAPESISKDYLGQRVEFRSFTNVGYSLSPELANHIGIGRQMEDVEFGGLNIFKDDPIFVLDSLRTVGGVPLEYLGFLVFMDLGVALTGFHDGDESQKAVSLFVKGAWDKRLEKMKAYDRW